MYFSKIWRLIQLLLEHTYTGNISAVVSSGLQVAICVLDNLLGISDQTLYSIRGADFPDYVLLA